MQWSVTLSHCGVTTVTFDLLNSGGADAAAVDIYRPEQDREEDVLQEDSTESDSDEFDM